MLCRVPDYAEYKRQYVKFHSLEDITLGIINDTWKGQNRLRCAERVDNPLILGSHFKVSVEREHPYYAE